MYWRKIMLFPRHADIDIPVSLLVKPTVDVSVKLVHATRLVVSDVAVKNGIPTNRGL